MTQPIKVLFIEDHPDDAQLVMGALKALDSKTNIQLEWVDRLEKGIRRLTCQPDLQAVLVALFLPESQGLETLQRVLACAPQIPVIVMTSQADEEVGMKALQAGAQDFLIKGQVDGRLLGRAIQYAIERKKTEMQLADAHEFTQRILTSAPIGIFTYRLGGQCVSVNAGAARMVGATVEQLERQNFRELASWRQSGLLDLAEKAIASKQLVTQDLHIFTTFGKDAWYRAQLVTFRSGGEELLMMLFSDITESKGAEAALAASEKRFRTWIENSSDIVTVLDANGIIQYESPSVKRVLGYEPEELLGKNAFDFIHPEDQGRIIATFTEKIQNPKAGVAAEFRFRHRNGSWRFLEGMGHTYVDEHGEVVALIHSRDIAERKQAEQTLRESEDRYRDLVEHIRDLIGTHDLDGKILSINPAATELLGFDMDTLLSMNIRDLLAPEVRGGFDDYLAAVQRDGRASGLMLLQTKHGERRLWEYDTTLREDSASGPVVRALARDVTERKRAEKALREKERLLSEAQRIGHIGSWSYDILTDSMKFSDEMYRLFDVLPEDFHHNREDFLALVYPSDRPVAAKWMRDLEEGSQAEDLNFRLFHKNGELCYLHCTGIVEFGADAKPARFIGTVQDVTERRATDMQINQQLQRLMALSEIDRAIISSFDQRYILGVILSQIISQLHVDAVDVLLLDPESDTLQLAAGHGFRTRMRETVRLRMGESHAGRAARERHMIRLINLRETTNDLAFSQLVIAEEFVSYIGVPLIVKGKLKGVLEVFQRSMLQPYQDWLDFFNTLVGQMAIAIENTSLFENLRTTNQELVQAYDATIEGWSRAMDLRDRETEGHTQRVTNLTLELARALEMDESCLVHIRRGALLHDIGKLGVPDHILFKAGTLTVEEREIIERHVDFAYEMLAPISYLKPALSIPYFHHEKWDGSGYPLGLKGEQIPLESRIFALVDVWDALLSDRPYRKAWTREQAIEYIRVQSGIHFDPRVVESFLRLLKD